MALPRFAFIVLLLVCSGLRAQLPAARIVTIDVSAVDSRGTPVSDLTAAELRVTDAGRRQLVAYFRRAQDVTAHQTALTRDYANNAYGTFPHATVVVLDQLNTAVELAGTEWDQIARSLGRAERDSFTFFYVLQKSGALYPLHPLPQSWVDWAPLAASWTRDLLPLFDEMRRQYRARPSDLDLSRMRRGLPATDQMMKRRQEYTETAVQEVATRLAAVPGPKRIVWVGHPPSGAPGQPAKDPTSQIREIGGNPLDPIPIYYVAPTAGRSVRGNPPGDGGIERTIERAMGDTQRGYRIGYDPPPANWDGLRHDVKVTCTRPGITVRAGGGYMAVRSVDIADDRRQIVPDIVAVSPFDASTIRFRIAELPDPDASRFDLRIDARDVFFRQENQRYAAALSIQALLYTEEGEVETPQEQAALNLNFSPDEYAQALRGGVPIRLAAKAAARGSRYRLVVYDRSTRSFGTLTATVEGALR